MKSSELKRILKLSKEFGAKRVKFEGVEVEFFDQPATQKGVGIPNLPTQPVKRTADPEAKMPSDEDILFWSVEDVVVPDTEQKAG
jgi:hypothetical protein